MEQIKEPTNIKQTKEIDIISCVQQVLKNKKSLFVSLVTGFIVGIIIAFNYPKSFTADVILVPEIASGGLGLSDNLADMASSFGIDLGNTGKNMDAFYPEIYPEIISSDDFIHMLFTVPVRLKNDDNERSYYHHLQKDTYIPFWQYPKMWLNEIMKPKDFKITGKSKNDPFKISRIDYEMCKAISNNIGCIIDKKTNIITISVTDQDPLVAAIIADTIQNRLQTYITEYRTKKARTDFNYYTKLYNEAKEKYNKAQKAYASFCDANQDVLLETYIAKRDELENEMQSAFTLMNQMSTQMQAAKAKIQERTPAYTMIKSAKMPYKASSMPKLTILFIIMFLAVLFDVIWVLFIKDFIKNKQ